MDYQDFLQSKMQLSGELKIAVEMGIKIRYMNLTISEETGDWKYEITETP